MHQLIVPFALRACTGGIIGGAEMTEDINSETASTDGGSGDLFNTAAGWVLFAGVVGLGLSILSDKFFHAYDPHAEQEGYVIEVAEAEGEAEMTIEEALSLVTAEDGERVFAKCAACHTIDAGGANGVGPNLHAIMGAPLGAKPGFAYSSGLLAKGGTWGWAEMNEWLDNPKKYIEGTKMGFAGLSSIEDRAAVSLYMNSQGSSLAVPEFVPPAEDEAPAEEGAAEAEAMEDTEAAAEAEQTEAAQLEEAGE